VGSDSLGSNILWDLIPGTEIPWYLIPEACYPVGSDSWGHISCGI
jgi:hypothetical protein